MATTMTSALWDAATTLQRENLLIHMWGFNALIVTYAARLFATLPAQVQNAILAQDSTLLTT